MANENKELVPAANVPQRKEDIVPVSQLVDNPDLAFKNDKLKSYLNQLPPAKWLKKNPFATKKEKQANGMVKEVDADYLPIDKHELLLDTIFQKWRIEVLREGIMFHSIYVTVRVHYKDPITGEWDFHDGVGAMKAQSDSGKPFSADTIKAAAVQMSLPAAKSYAIKDACEHIGKIFGRDINRPDTWAFNGVYKEPTQTTPEDDRMIAVIRACKTRTELQKLASKLTTPEHRTLYDDLWAKLK